MKFTGKVIKYGDNVDTDVIIPARYLNVADAKELAKHCMVDIDPTFVERVQEGDIMVAGDNFGCGSSREHAPIAIKASGVAVVVAKSFARIFYRNSINTGLPIAEYSGNINEGDMITVDFDNGTLENHTTGEKGGIPILPPSLQKIISAGGLLKTVEAK